MSLHIYFLSIFREYWTLCLYKILVIVSLSSLKVIEVLNILLFLRVDLAGVTPLSKATNSLKNLSKEAQGLRNYSCS